MIGDIAKNQHLGFLTASSRFNVGADARKQLAGEITDIEGYTFTYECVGDFFTRPIFCIRDKSGNFNEHIADEAHPTRRPDVYEVAIKSKFADGSDAGFQCAGYFSSGAVAKAKANLLNRTSAVTS